MKISVICAAAMFAFAISSDAGAQGIACSAMYSGCMAHGAAPSRCATWLRNAERTGYWAGYTHKGRSMPDTPCIRSRR